MLVLRILTLRDNARKLRALAFELQRQAARLEREAHMLEDLILEGI